MYYAINEETARHANEMNSFSAFVPGRATESYKSQVDAVYELAEKQKAKVDPYYHEKIDDLADLYARKLADNINKENEIDCRYPSILVAGPANFNCRAKEKQNWARDANREDWKNIEALKDKIRGVGMGGISSDEPEAERKLKDKIKGLEMAHEEMKKCNAYWKKHQTLDGLEVSPEVKKAAIKNLSFWASYREAKDLKPFDSYNLSNNKQNIKRLQKRLEELSNRSSLEGWEFDGGKVVCNQEANRVQILFDDKPDSDVRSELKQNGFRWAPSQGAWQRQLNENGIRAAKRVTNK